MMLNHIRASTLVVIIGFSNSAYYDIMSAEQGGKKPR